jgi:hypothetical protein
MKPNLCAFLTLTVSVPYLSAMLQQPYTIAPSSTFLQKPTNLELFLQPLMITPYGVEFFFSQMYNNKRYSEDFLPNNFSHLLQFLEHGKQSQQGKEFVKSTLTLFSQKLKSCSYANAYAFADFLLTMPSLVDHFFMQQTKSVMEKKNLIKQAIYHQFLTHSDDLKENSAQFFDNLSSSILQAINPDLEEPITTEYLRQTIIRFLEIGLNKLIWDPQDKDLWQHIMTIAERLSLLVDHKIITNTDDLNDLYWSLIHRLGYFIENARHNLQPEFFQAMSQVLAGQSVKLFELEEVDELAETKKQYIQRLLIEEYARTEAEKQGIIA